MTECEKVFRASKLEANRQICAGGGIDEGDNAGIFTNVFVNANYA